MAGALGESAGVVYLVALGPAGNEGWGLAIHRRALRGYWANSELDRVFRKHIRGCDRNVAGASGTQMSVAAAVELQ
jgi:hypothetical protein